MDIFSYAESINYGADYMDMYTGRIYKIQEYGKIKRLHDSTTDPAVLESTQKELDRGIGVEEDGVLIGYAKRAV